MKVFFRVWGTEAVDTDWDPEYTYLSHTDTDGNPLWPLASSDNYTFPCFATRDPDFTDPNNAELGADGVNNRTITIEQGDSQWTYFGCFLDIYGENLTFNGVQITKVPHHCLVAQIAYANAPIQTIGNAIISPTTSSQLAQRNLQVTSGDDFGSLTAPGTS